MFKKVFLFVIQGGSPIWFRPHGRFMITFEHPVIDGTKRKIDIKALFPDIGKPLKVEIGFGNGGFIFEKVQRENDANFLGIELYHRGICSLAKRIRKYNINNIIIIYADAKRILVESVQDNALSELYVNFPDPWPKRRHQKRRLINCNFAKLIYSKLEHKGRIYLATDSKNYANEMLNSFEGTPGYKNLAGRLRLAQKTPNHIVTKYEKRFLSNGNKIYYLQYQAQK